MAKVEYEVLRGALKTGTGRQVKEYLPGDIIALDEADAANLVASGRIIAVGEKPRPRPKSEAARIKQLEAELAEARKGGTDPTALADAIARAEKAEEALKATVPMAQHKAAQDAKAAVDAELAQANDGLAQFQEQVATLTLRVTEAEEIASDAGVEAESLARVVALVRDQAPEIVAKAEADVQAEYEAAEAAVAANPQG